MHDPHARSFATDNGPECPHCTGTVYLYAVEGEGEVGFAHCVGCRTAVVFKVDAPETPREMREMHERACAAGATRDYVA